MSQATSWFHTNMYTASETNEPKKEYGNSAIKLICKNIYLWQLKSLKFSYFKTVPLFPCFHCIV
jgi:hypothetical protein